MDYQQRLLRAIPGGAHTYSRGFDQFPSNAPQILERGEGAYVWDPEGRRFLDYGMALRAITLGYGFPSVAKAASEEILKGNNLTRASTTELEAAELIVDLIPSAEIFTSVPSMLSENTSQFVEMLSKLFEKGICLPSGSNLSDKEQNLIIDIIKSMFR